ncbi:DENN domain-containing protein 3 isoform X2 [Talpa occidentalis]|uniref:DENN domain-containing protein 3 isoform X2 n=1 Tax=Talpa occidentalis TaxID=50954 RepID=UPI00188EBF58|nr:DENN domain-containing protein 3 isoform X2 [Talpa occidentalis]
MAEAAPQGPPPPAGLLELCALLGAPRGRRRGPEQVAQKKGVKGVSLEPEVLSVFVPPFVCQEDGRAASAKGATLSKARRRSFRKKRERPSAEAWQDQPGGPRGPEPEDISVPDGVDLLALPQLCFPGGMCVASAPKEDYVHFLVLTDVCGNRTYGVVAQYHRPLQDEHCFYNGRAHREPSGPTASAAGCFVPFAVCVVSRFPYYNAFKDCLSCLLTQLKLCKDFEVDNHIKDFAAKLSLIPSPPPGPLHLMLNMKPLQVVFPSRADPDSPLIDLDLHLPFLCFRPEKVLQILTCLLTEQRVVLFSSNWALLTLVAECFLAFLHPLQWQHTFVPVLSSQMLDFLMAPTSFLMGCHLDHFEEVSKEADGLVLISVDSGSVTCSNDQGVSVPNVPLLEAQTFIQRAQSLRLHYELDLAHLAASTDLSEGRARRRAWQQDLNCQIQHMALQLLVGIFRDVKNHLNYEHRVFNSAEFLKTRAPGDQQFYRQVLDTYMFHSFLKARLSRTMDAFAQMDLSTQSKEDRINGMLISPRRPTIEKIASRKPSALQVAHRRMVVSMPDLQAITVPELLPRNSSLRTPGPVGHGDSPAVPNVPPKATYTFKIPEVHFPLVSQCVQAYYTDCVALLTKAMGLLAPDHSALLARYFYLRGFVYLMQGQLLAALLDFQSLYKTDVRIFPAALVRRTVESMAAPERAQAECTPELRRLISEVTDQPCEAPKADDRVKNFELPRQHMPLDDFVKRVQESGIVRDTSTINRLFEALTVGHQKLIDPDTFRDFYTCWKETEAEAQEVSLPPSAVERLDKNECVYKLSSSVKTSRGVGKIAMTQKRLFLLTEGRPGFVDIAAFRDIEEVRSTTVAFLVLRIPTLKIKTAARKDAFEANLKTECDLWCLMVKEMWAGKQLADGHKDPQYIQQALTHALLMDAVVGTLQSPGAIYAASKLSVFDKMKTEMPMAMPKTTSETLKHKINPSAGETLPLAVDVLLYTPGHLDPAEKAEDAHPKLWCALSEGKVVVFDASSWTVHQHCFKVGAARLTCMAMVEQSQVWVGSEDSVIYIISVHSMSCNKQLTDHRHGVTHLAVPATASAPSEVYSCSVDGTVLAWNASTLRVTSRFQLPGSRLSSISPHEGHLWCCTGDSIAVVTTSGFLRQELRIDENSRETGTSFLGFQLLPEEQLWAAYTGCPNIYIWSLKDLARPPERIPLQDCAEVTCMIRVKSQVWVGGTGLSPGAAKGKIYVIDAARRAVEKELAAHADSVRTLCSAEGRYVLSGSGQQEGKIAIWTVE